MVDWRTCDAVERIPGKVSRAWLSKGTRIPVRALFENVVDSGATLEEFVEWFPGVTVEQARAALDHAHENNPLDKPV